jgi:hypothetical protein
VHKISTHEVGSSFDLRASPAPKVTATFDIGRNGYGRFCLRSINVLITEDNGVLGSSTLGTWEEAIPKVNFRSTSSLIIKLRTF